MNSTVPLFTEIPETLQESMNNYLESHPDWDQNRVLTAALSLFLLQNMSGHCLHLTNTTETNF